MKPPVPADKTREKLLAAAFEQFAEHDFHCASLRDIARAAGTNVALISYYFGGKEQLYREMLQNIVHTRVHGSLKAMPDFTAQTPSPAEARSFLKKLLTSFVTSAFSSGDILLAARLIIREQTRPSPAFDVVYKNGIETMHRTVTRLLAIASGRVPETQDSIIRAHMLVGQMFSFVFANAVICRRLGKKSIDKRTLATITAILDENIDALCTA